MNLAPAEQFLSAAMEEGVERRDGRMAKNGKRRGLVLTGFLACLSALIIMLNVLVNMIMQIAEKKEVWELLRNKYPMRNCSSVSRPNDG